MHALILPMEVFVAKVNQQAYNPLQDPVYMSAQMKNFFQSLLVQELQKYIEEDHFCTAIALAHTDHESDLIDQGTTENLRFNHHVFHEHEKQLCRQVELALQRLACGNYGYCVVTGEPIGVNRLIAAPYTAYCLDAQEENELSRH